MGVPQCEVKKKPTDPHTVVSFNPISANGRSACENKGTTPPGTAAVLFRMVRSDGTWLNKEHTCSQRDSSTVDASL